MTTSNNYSKPDDDKSSVTMKDEPAFKKVEEEKEDGGCGLSFEKGSSRKKKTVVLLSAANGTVAPPCCQVESCSVGLSNERYYRRHKVCQLHAKAPVVLLAGTLQRFCQQCSRFHELTEFDKAKRSCRRRLAGHNERRRKCSSETHKEASSSQLKGIQHRQAN